MSREVTIVTRANDARANAHNFCPAIFKYFSPVKVYIPNISLLLHLTRLESKVFSLEKLCLSLFSLVLSP